MDDKKRDEAVELLKEMSEAFEKVLVHVKDDEDVNVTDQYEEGTELVKKAQALLKEIEEG